MNYDFSEKEFTFFVEISELIDSFVKDRNIGANDAQISLENLQDLLKTLSKTPYLKLCMTNKDRDNGMIQLMEAMAIIAATSPSLCLSVETSVRIFGRIVSAWGNDDQQEKILAPLLDGQLIGAVGLSEDSMNVINDPLKTIGVSDGTFVNVTGRKQYVINGPVCDWFAVAGLMDEKVVIFMIEKNTPGLEVGERKSTIGYDGVAISEIRLADCTIPIEQVIIPENETDPLTTLRFWENQVLIGVSLGLMKSAFESAKDYAKQHKTGGKPIIAYQEVGFKLSEMLTLLQTSQLFAYRAAWAMHAEPKEADTLTLCAKVFCTESAETVTSTAMKILGGDGYFTKNPAEKAYRCSKYGQIAGTSSEISRVIIGDTALGLRK